MTAIVRNQFIAEKRKKGASPWVFLPAAPAS